MIYTITPEQEKAALNEALQSMWGDKFKSLMNQSLLLSDIVSKTNMTNADKADVVAGTLSYLSHEFYVTDEDRSEYGDYQAHKNHFDKYANQDFFGVIDGVSFTADHFNTLYSSLAFDQELMNASLPFSFIKNIDNYNRLFSELASLPKSFDKLTLQDLTKIGVHFEVLELNHFAYSDSHYQKMLEFLRLMPSISSHTLVVLAACPRTSNLITKEDFLTSAQVSDDDSLNELSQAYQDLFGEELVIDSYEA